jgi:hypothetical protein
MGISDYTIYVQRSGDSSYASMIKFLIIVNYMKIKNEKDYTKNSISSQLLIKIQFHFLIKITLNLRLS